jgi:biopolymer transport protein TolR
MSKIRKRNSGFDTIEMTNLIDVLMVLLILFMIIAPPVFRQNAAKIKLPEASIDTIEVKSDLQVFLTRNGEIFIDNRQFDPDSLKKHLENLKVEKAIINADQDVAYSKVLDVISLLQDMKAESISLSADRKDTRPASTGPNTTALGLPVQTR